MGYRFKKRNGRNEIEDTFVIEGHTTRKNTDRN